MTDLLRRIESATEGSRELDQKIADYFNLGTTDNLLIASFGDVKLTPHYTTSVDDALRLVPGDQRNGWALLAWIDGIHFEARIDKWGAVALSPALALCAAALRSIIEGAKDGKESNTDGFPAGSCAHCGEFHSHICDAMKATLAGEGT